MNATSKLLRLMIENKECAEFIQNGWLHLYTDIILYAGTGKLSKLDDISRYALLDWYKYKENK